ncbi:hypothetical protein [uncultured Mucilaginibacter sp.]|uniref:hypothetical protein n=1 Tax=uncultured Mucilaginibacter sp. TaxID=797541 RepID=UPI0025FAF1B3|nr:hypothetical protein [uncultured Mucilaginibacter sp.]
MTASSGQSKSNDYNLTLDFGPSFMSASEVSIQAKGDSCFLNIRVYRNYKTKETSFENKAVIPANKTTALTTFLKTYKFQIKSNIDTIGSNKELVGGDSVLVYSVSMGSDGIDVSGYFNQNAITHKFAFWSPRKGTENAKLMVILFDLLDSTFTEQKMINYVEQLEQYFPHQLGLKKLSDQPLIYKLFGSISSDEADEFYDFLDKLPSHQKVIIDMSNFSGMGTMFYDAFDEFHINRKNVYWLNPTSQALINLNKLGIQNRKIIKNKKLVKTKKDGRDVFSLEDD